MTSYVQISRDELLARTHDDFVRWVCMPDDVGVWGDDGWGVTLQWFPSDRVGGFVSGGQECFDALTALRADTEQPIMWCSRPLDQAHPAEQLSGPAHGEWDFMTAYEVRDERPSNIAIIDIDDVACADEITAFAKRLNPLFEGNPGDGRSIAWRAIRDDDGVLRGTICAKRLRSGVPHLAGLIVDEGLRGTGAGRALLVDMTRRCLEEFGVCTLGVYHNNTRAIDLYAGVGYRHTHAFASYGFDRERRQDECPG